MSPLDRDHLPSMSRLQRCLPLPLRRRTVLFRFCFRWALLFSAVSLCVWTTLMFFNNSTLGNLAIKSQIMPTRGTSGGNDPDAVFKPKNTRDRGPLGYQQVPPAIHSMPHRHKLLEVQQDIIVHQKRPPDSAYNLNVTLSDSISLDRCIDDTRPRPCRAILYDLDGLPSASIVIPFYNEALSMLLRTIHSILNRSPDQLLKEVILVDDNSTHGYLKEPLDRYIRLLPKIRIVRNRNREGLIRSRLFGADVASAPVLIFLDAHTEVNVGWLEPMLRYIQEHPDSVVQPFVDGIDVQSLVYSKPRRLHRGTFSWDLRYVWVKLPDHIERRVEEEGLPFWAPTLVGCAIAVNRSYFNSIGAFDAGQKIWGGENIELAFRVWMCGGTVVTLPCSRVGHAFKELPYKIDDRWQNPWQRNLMRVADTWMDDFKKYFYSSTRIYENRRVEYTTEEKSSLQTRIDLRKKLKCKSFEWYLTNVAPDIPIPPWDAKFHGEIANYRSQACWEVLDDDYLGMSYSCYEHKIITENTFSLNEDGLLTYRDRCVKFMFPEPTLKLVTCPEKLTHSFGRWKLVFKDQKRWSQIMVTLRVDNKLSTWCVMQVTSAVSSHKRRQMPQTATCDDTNMFQFWGFSYRFDYKD